MTPTVEAEEPEHRPHPVRVALRQVLVHRDHVHALAGERVQVRRQRRHQGLALAGAHLGDLAQMQRQAADQLHVEVAQPEHAARRLPHQGEGLGEQRIERRAGGEARLELLGLLRKLLVLERSNLGLEAIRGDDRAAQLLDEALITAAEYLGQKLPHAEESLKNWVLYG